MKNNFKKTIFMIFVFMILIIVEGVVTLGATPILYKSDDQSQTTDTICSDEKYTFVQDTQPDYQYILILDENNQLLEVIPNNEQETTIEIPEDEDNIQIATINYSNGEYDFDTISRQSYSVTDCSTEKDNEDKVAKDKYTSKRLQAGITVENNNITFSKPEDSSIEEYSLKYQFPDGVNSKDISFEQDNDVTIDSKDSDIVQVEETYSKNGKEKHNYYEIELYENDYIIRNVDDFNVKEIKFRAYLNFKRIILLLILIVALVVVIHKRKKLKNQNKKRSDNKIKKSKNKRRKKRRRRNE